MKCSIQHFIYYKTIPETDAPSPQILGGGTILKRELAGQNCNKRFGWILTLCLVTFALVTPLLSPITRATSITQITPTTSTPCLNANQISGSNLISGQGPNDKTWAVIVTFGLDGGDNTQNVRFYFDLIDDNLGKGVAFYGTAETDWNDHNTYSRYTLTAHIGTTFTLYYDIENDDAYSQCFYVNAYPGYF